MDTLTALIDRHGIEVDEHLDRQATVPILTGMQRQGDVLFTPDPEATATTPVPREGVPVVRGEAGGNTHLLLADGPVFCDPRTATVADLTLATMTVPEGSVAYLAHPEHGYMGLGEGSYTVRRQRQQSEEVRLVAD